MRSFQSFSSGARREVTALGRKEYSMPLTNVEADEEAHTVRVRQHSLPTRMTATPRPGCRSTPARVFPPGLCSASLADRPPPTQLVSVCACRNCLTSNRGRCSPAPLPLGRCNGRTVGLGAAAHSSLSQKYTRRRRRGGARHVADTWALGAVSAASILVQPPTGRTMSSSSQ